MNKKLVKVIYIINIVIIVSILAYLIYLGFHKYHNKNDGGEYVQFRGYQFKLEDDLETGEDRGVFIITNYNEGWSARIVIYNDPKNAIIGNATKIEEIFRYKGYDVSDLYIHTIGKEKYLSLKMNQKEEGAVSSVLLGYYKPNNKHICEITLTDDVYGSLNYDAFDRVVKILKSNKYDSVTDEKYQYFTISFDDTIKELYGSGTEETVE